MLQHHVHEVHDRSEHIVHINIQYHIVSRFDPYANLDVATEGVDHIEHDMSDIQRLVDDMLHIVHKNILNNHFELLVTSILLLQVVHPYVQHQVLLLHLLLQSDEV